jgi:hypothetical protein
MNYPPEAARWSERAKEAYEERICILSEGKEITPEMIQIATKEAQETNEQNHSSN